MLKKELLEKALKEKLKGKSTVDSLIKAIEEYKKNKRCIICEKKEGLELD